MHTQNEHSAKVGGKTCHVAGMEQAPQQEKHESGRICVCKHIEHLAQHVQDDTLRVKPAEVLPIAAPADVDTALSMHPSTHAYAGACIQAPTWQLPVAVSCFQALADATCNHIRLFIFWFLCVSMQL